jgi:hypothetical protein
MVKPATNLSRNQLNTKAIGTATSTVAACNDCQKNTSPRNSVDTPGADVHLRGRGHER